MQVIRYGDLQLILFGSEYLVIACDSSGGIGNKEGDQLQVDPEIAGYYAAFVPLIECMAVRGEVISLIDTLSVEMVPTGERIIHGIKKAVSEAGCLAEQITGSTEDNIETKMTGIGVTVIGKVAKERVDRPLNSANKKVYLVGKPKVGQELFEEEILGKMGEVLTLEIMQRLIRQPFIEQLLPIGSKGIVHEIQVLEKRYGHTITMDNKEIDVNKSAGPATCLLITVDATECEHLEKIKQRIPVTYIGRFKE